MRYFATILVVLALGACRGGPSSDVDAGGDGDVDLAPILERWEDACLANCERDRECGNAYNCELFCADRAERHAADTDECVDSWIDMLWCYSDVDCEDDAAFVCEDLVREWTVAC